MSDHRPFLWAHGILIFHKGEAFSKMTRQQLFFYKYILTSVRLLPGIDGIKKQIFFEKTVEIICT